MIYLEKNDIYSTLCTWLYCHFWMMWAAEQQGERVYIHWPKGKFLKSYEDDKKFAEIPNAYDWYFTQPKTNCNYCDGRGCISCTDRDLLPSDEEIEIWTWEQWIDPNPLSLMAMPLSFIKDYYKKHLHFNEETNKRGQAIVEKYKIDFSKTIGITWRGTDVYLDGRFRTPIERYYKHIDRFIEEVPDLRIACTAEEDGILEPLLKRYPQAFKINEFYQAPFGSLHNPERFSPMSGFERGLQPALMVWLFSKCAFYIKNRSSTGAVASWLSDGFIVNIGHPETLSHDNKIDKDEIKGVWHDA